MLQKHNSLIETVLCIEWPLCSNVTDVTTALTGPRVADFTVLPESGNKQTVIYVQPQVHYKRLCPDEYGGW